MHQNLTPIKEALQSLTEVVTATIQNTFDAINHDKDQLAAIVARINDNHTLIEDLSVMLSSSADELFNMAGELDFASDNINLMMESIDNTLIPTSPIEKFVGYCDECGDEITIDDPDYSDLPEEGLLCGDCVLAASEVIETCEKEEA